MGRATALVTMLLVLGVAAASAQDFEVSFFESASYDGTASAPATSVLDFAGRPCALIKVQTPLQGLHFDVGQSYIEVQPQDETHPEEVWVYVSPGTRLLSVHHAQAGNIIDYDPGMPLESGHTYLMGLGAAVSGTSATPDRPVLLRIHTVPGGVTLTIDGIQIVTDRDGYAEHTVNAGQHRYQAEAPLYHTGRGTIRATGNTVDVPVTLDKAYGLLSTPSGAPLDGARAWIDGSPVGLLPLSGLPVASGRHRIRVIQNLYAVWEQPFEMTDNASLEIIPQLIPDYGRASITVTDIPGVTLFIDGDKKPLQHKRGTCVWSDDLGSGEHSFEIHAPSHRPVEGRFRVSRLNETRLTPASPEPLYGSLTITSTPYGAEVFIDGKEAGRTPLAISHMLIGRHEVEVRRPGCRTESFTADIAEGQLFEHDCRLRDYFDIALSSDPAGAYVTIDGASKGTTPVNLTGDPGNYDIRMTCHGYVPKRKTLHLDGTSPASMTWRLRRDLVPRNEFYFLAAYRMLNDLSEFDFGMGFYASNVNIEASLIVGLSKPEHVNTDTPLGFNVRVGYGIPIAGRVRITPRIGLTGIYFKPEGLDYGYGYSYDDIYDYFGEDHKYNALGGDVSIKVGVSLCRGIRFFLEPQYSFVFSHTDGDSYTNHYYEDCARRYVNGFHLAAGINFFF